MSTSLKEAIACGADAALVAEVAAEVEEEDEEA